MRHFVKLRILQWIEIGFFSSTWTCFLRSIFSWSSKIASKASSKLRASEKLDADEKDDSEKLDIDEVDEDSDKLRVLEQEEDKSDKGETVEKGDVDLDPQGVDNIEDLRATILAAGDLGPDFLL